MAEKYNNKYRIASARAQWWDYGSNAAYFITICTKTREHRFGEIVNDAMQLSHVGVLADVFWHEIKHHAQNVELDAFVVMPNHIHGILILNGDNDKCDNGNDDDIRTTDDTGNVETRHTLSLLQSPELSPAQQRFQNQGKNTVSSIIGSYKSAVTKHANRLGLEIEWQPRFHDHIIRDDAEFSRITNYIETNISNWLNDKFYKSTNHD